ncbi:MAG: DUF2478 domain-containing protein [Rhodospirillales bacterium]|nr:DUF2478 domain-containing protein [Rhodospirillales bacterium]
MATQQDTHNPAIRAAAVIYTPETEEGSVLAAFAKELKAQGLNVGGLTQQAHFDDKGIKDGIDAIAVDTGEHIPLKRPTESDFVNGVCSLDYAALTESTGAIRRAITNRVDLMVVEKFGEQEQKGDGLADEILAAMAEGIPVLILVPASALDKWNHFSGGLADTLSCSLGDVRRWWEQISPA